MEVKVVCGCGQKYKFDVEPVHGRMPWPVNCPVCNADGTALANASIAQSVPPTPVPAPQPAGLRISSPAPAMSMPVTARVAAPAPAPAPVAAPAPALAEPVMAAPLARAASDEVRGAIKRITGVETDSDGDTWKWWYYVVAGVCFAGYDVWRAYDTQRIKPLGGLFLAVILVAVGLWQRKRKAA